MRIKPSVLAAVACGGWLLVGCNARETAAPAARQTPSPPPSAESATPAAREGAATAVEATPATIPKAPPSAAADRPAAATEGAGPASKPPPSRRPRQSEAVPEPAREVATPIPPAPLTSAPAAPTQVASASKMVDPGGQIAVTATRAGLTRIGAEKCKICHKIQFASWVETAHAKRTPPLDCESCHGPGSEYKSLAVMKDPQKAKAAGLVIPAATFCKTCHTRGWKDDMLRKAHAHKTLPGS